MGREENGKNGKDGKPISQNRESWNLFLYPWEEAKPAGTAVTKVL